MRHGSKARPMPPALWLLALLAACGGDQTAPPPNVLVVTLDTLRLDRVGAYGASSRALTPRIDQLSAQGVRFTRAFANSSFTPPAHGSLFTGLYPSEHGLTYWSEHLADVPTGAQLFAAAGYRTAAFSPLPTLFKIGLDAGFETTASPPLKTGAGVYPLADGEQVNDLAIPWLRADDARPFFAWVHFYDAHRPYARQGEHWWSLFGRHDPLVGSTEDWYQLTPEKRQKLGVEAEQVAAFKDRYDGGVAYLDAQVGRLLDALDTLPRGRNTIVVLVADHGEVFDEHDEEWFSHDPHLYEENVHIPFVLRLPAHASAGKVVEALVSQVDLLPTLLELARLPAPERQAGSSLVPLIEGGTLRRSFVYGERRGKDGALDRKRMLRTLTHKLVHDVDQERLRLFALPDELSDVRASQPETDRQLERSYRGLLGTLRPAGSQQSGFDEETEEFLRRLGYVGSAPGDGQR